MPQMLIDFSHPLVVGILLTVLGGAITFAQSLTKSVNEVKHILIGADGKNGVRGDVRELKGDRARDRLLREQTIEVQTRILADSERLREDIARIFKRLERLEEER